MPTQMNHEGGKNYKVTSPESMVNKAQTNHDGGRTTKKAGNSRSAQMNHPQSIDIPKPKGGETGSHCNTGTDGGY